MFFAHLAGSCPLWPGQRPPAAAGWLRRRPPAPSARRLGSSPAALATVPAWLDWARWSNRAVWCQSSGCSPTSDRATDRAGAPRARAVVVQAPAVSPAALALTVPRLAGTGHGGSNRARLVSVAGVLCCPLGGTVPTLTEGGARCRCAAPGALTATSLVGRPSFRLGWEVDRLARAAPPGPSGAVRDRGQPLRRPRRRHQHHAPAAAGPGRRGHPPGPQPLRRRGGHRRRPGGRPGRGRQLLPGRPRRVLPLPGRPPAGRRPRRHAGVRRWRRHHRRRPRSTSCSATGWPASSRPRTARPWAWPPWSTPWSPSATIPWPPPTEADLEAAASAGDHRALARRDHRRRDRHARRRRPARLLAAGRRPAPGAGPRHHRHRGVGEVVADRRAGPPLPPRPGGQAARSPCWPSTRPGARAAGPCSATASA